jgi:hypothetical protein
MKPKKFDAIDPWPLIIPRATFISRRVNEPVTPLHQLWPMSLA